MIAALTAAVVPRAAARRLRAARWLVAGEVVALFVAVLAALVVASRRFGLTWDEVSYFRYADSIRAWWGRGAPLDEGSLLRYWAYDTYTNPHPPLMKIVAAIVQPWASRWLSYPTDYRLGHFVCIATGLTAVFALLRDPWGRLASLAAIACAALQPRVFGHLLIAATDSPVAMAWLLLPLLAWRLDLGPSRRYRCLLWGAFFLILGAAAATKFTGLLAALPLAGWQIARRRWREAGLTMMAGACAIGFVVTASPYLWRHPLRGALGYLRYPFTRTALPFSTAYLGRLYGADLPWHYFLVMSLITMPPLLLALLVPAARAAGPLRELLAPVGAAIFFWLVLLHLPGTPRHDEIRQFVSVYPLLGIASWAGLLALRERLAATSPCWRGVGMGRAALALPCAWLALTVAWTHPFELSHYNALIGGIRGAERAGMELSPYFEAVDRSILAAIDSQVLPGQKLFMSPYWPPLLRSYADHGLLRGGFSVLPERTTVRPDWLLLVRRRYLFDDRLFVALPAVRAVRYDGVELVKLVRVADVGGAKEASR